MSEEKGRLKIINDYFIQYDEECELFSLHKPSDIRCLIEILNNELNRQNVEIIKYGDIKFNGSEIVDLLNEMNESIQYLNAFLVERGLAEEYIRWKGDV